VNGARWLAASGHHIPQHDANALGWAVVIVIVALALAALLRMLGIFR
jgi:hypothetical protein